MSLSKLLFAKGKERERGKKEILRFDFSYRENERYFVITEILLYWRDF